MPKTRRDLVLRALKNLGVLPQGSTPSDEDYDSMDDLVTPLLEELSALNIVYVSDQEAIDDSVFLSLANLLADRARPEAGSEGFENSQRQSLR